MKCVVSPDGNLEKKDRKSGREGSWGAGGGGVGVGGGGG